MIIQNIANPRATQELSREKWNKLGARQKLFKILDEKDSPALKKQVIPNDLGKANKGEGQKPAPKSEKK